MPQSDICVLDDPQWLRSRTTLPMFPRMVRQGDVQSALRPRSTQDGPGVLHGAILLIAWHHSLASEFTAEVMRISLDLARTWW